MATLEEIRHSASHVLAAAIKRLWPNTKFGIGPTIENGFYYDFDLKHTFSPEDLPKIEEEAKKIIKENQDFIRKEISKEEAKKLFKDQPYKLELIEELEGNLSIYINGDFTDLCRGPHIKNTKEIKAFKLLKVSGSYWKGDAKNTQMQRIYGTAFDSKEALKEYLTLQEEAKKRDHRKLGTELDLFSFHEESPGCVFIHPKGMIIWNELLNYWREIHKEAGYVEVKTPILLNRSLWEESGHWTNYKENMYTLKIDDIDYGIKPMNCPGGIILYRSKLHSYKELPLRIGEIGLVHRHELSGVLMGLFRVRCFHQDDAHIYCTEDQIKDEVKRMFRLFKKVYQTFGLQYHIELSTRPTKFVGEIKTWDKTEQIMKEILQDENIKYNINEGDGAFYGPKFDFHLKDSIGRTWQCGTIQIDFNLPQRFNLTYEGQDGQKHQPIMLHRVVYGSMERFFGILTEHYAGKFPLWLAPTQVAIMTVADRHLEYAEKLKKELEENNIRILIDDRQESIAKKVRDAQLQKIPYMITIGDKEQESEELPIRNREGNVSTESKLDFIKRILKEIKEKA